MRRENLMSRPVFSSLSSSNRTPLAETLRVCASSSALPVESATGSSKGKRTAHRTSWRGGSDEVGTPDLRAFIKVSLQTRIGLTHNLIHDSCRAKAPKFSKGNLRQQPDLRDPASPRKGGKLHLAGGHQLRSGHRRTLSEQVHHTPNLQQRRTVIWFEYQSFIGQGRTPRRRPPIPGPYYGRRPSSCPVPVALGKVPV